jgi:hypothetical protein
VFVAVLSVFNGASIRSTARFALAQFRLAPLLLSIAQMRRFIANALLFTERRIVLAFALRDCIEPLTDLVRAERAIFSHDISEG